MLPNIIRREHQIKALGVAREVLGRDKIPCLTVPTGGGKTLIGIDIAERAINFNPNAKALIISNLSPLMSQWDESVLKFCGYELHAYTDYLWGKKQRHPTQLNGKKIIIAMAQTIESRQWIPDSVSVVIWDEAHLSWFRHKCREVVHRLAPNANHILLTATPHRLDGQEFGADVEIKQVISLRELISKGYLTPFRAKRIGNWQVQSKSGSKEDFTQAEIEQVIEKVSPAKVFEEWVKHGYSVMPTIGVAPSKAQCKKYCDYFISQGFLGVVVSDETPEGNDKKAEEEIKLFYEEGYLPKTRKGACALFRQGQLMLWSVKVLTIGFDEPCAQVLLFLSATKSPAQLTQSVGRILRKHPNKEEAYVLDFVGSMVNLGRPDEIEDWNDVHTMQGKECPNCQYICGKSQHQCPDCGYEFPRAAPKERDEQEMIFNNPPANNPNYFPPDSREMEEIPFLDRNAEPKLYYQNLLRRYYAAGKNPDSAYYEFRDIKKFDPSRDWSTHAVFGANPTFNDAVYYLAYLRRIQSYTGKSEKWIWTQMSNEFRDCLTFEWRKMLQENIVVNLVG